MEYFFLKFYYHFNWILEISPELKNSYKYLQEPPLEYLFAYELEKLPSQLKHVFFEFQLKKRGDCTTNFYFNKLILHLLHIAQTYLRPISDLCPVCGAQGYIHTTAYYDVQFKCGECDKYFDLNTKFMKFQVTPKGEDLID